MLKNYLLIAWRNLNKNKGYSFLNILGLAVGMAVFVLIFLYVQHELSFDRWHENADRIFRVVQHQPGNMYLGSDRFAVTQAPLAAALMQEFPEVMAATRIGSSGNVLLTYGEKNFLEKNVHWADPYLFKVFSIELLRGDPETALTDPHSILFSESVARKFFGDQDPIGQTVVYIEEHDMRVTGVFKDFPKNSHFTMDVILPFDAMPVLLDRKLDSWGNSSFYTYFLLQEGADHAQLEGKLPDMFKKYRNDQGWDSAGYILQPLTRIHLYSNINFDISPGNDIRYIYLFSSIAFLLLVIACINYMNLATARSAKRAKEVGMRKVVGARRNQLIKQFLGESTMLTLVALVLTLGLVVLSLPAFKGFIQRDLSFDPLHNPGLLLGVMGTFVLVGLLAGAYPAVYISRFKPISALRSASSKGKGGALFRNLLVVFQFTVSILLILSTVVVRNQLHYIQNKEMGYSRDHIVVVRPRDTNLQQQLEALKTELKNHPDVLSVAASSSLPNHVSSQTNAKWPGKPEDLRVPIYVCDADYDFLDVFDLKLAQGRNFSREHVSDAKGAFLLNEAAVQAIGVDAPLGMNFNRWGNEEPAGQIVGILKDFHMHSLHQEIKPMYVFLDLERDYRNISIKIRGERIPSTLAHIEETMLTFSPKYPFEYSFFDEVFDRAYRAEQRIEGIFSTFALLTVFIACLGLFGLSSFTAESRTREIGIRKVLGASSPSILQLLSRDYVKKVLIANVLAWPLGYYAMYTWLQNFAYRIDLGVFPFLGASLIALLIALLTVSFQTFRAAAANPADSLRYE
ncbi:MAG: ABC transporter permease [Candidatus Aminicenantaceae bacterium]